MEDRTPSLWSLALALIIVAVVALALGMGASGRTSTIIFKHRPGTTYGDIHIGDARVSSRERMINDRLTQDAWLRKELDRTDQQDFGFQGAVDLRSFVGSSTRVEANLDPTQISQYRSQQAQSADAVRRQNEQADLDNQLLRQYKQRQMEAMTQQPATDFTYTLPASDAKKADTPPAPPNAQTAIEDVRKIKDDVGKSTIDPSTIKLPDKIKPSPQEVLRDKLEYRGMIRNEIIENALDDRHDLRGNTLLRFDLDAAVLPENDTSAWAVINVEIDTTNWKQTCIDTKLYAAWIAYLERELRERAFLLIRYGEEAGHTYEEQEKRKKPGASESELARANIGGMVSFLPDYLLLEIQRYEIPELEKSYSTATDIVIKKAQKRNAEPTKDQYKHQLYTAIGHAHKRLINGLHGKYVIANVEKEALKVRKVDKGPSDADFCKALHYSQQIYAYASTPKETVQRVAEVASHRNVNEFLLTLSFLAGNTATGKVSQDFMRVNDGIFQAVRRQPLVVGYSNGTTKVAGANKAPCTSPPCTLHTEFGWILGPKFTINDQGTESHYRHTTAFNSLSGVVSLPGWLSEVEFKIRTYWIVESGSEPLHVKTQVIPVRLNPDLSTIIDVLADEEMNYFMSTRGPRPYTRQILEFEEGSSASIVIPGQNLWRNSVVLLGGQVADEVAVLPNMRGLIVKFKEIRLQESHNLPEVRPLFIWTSEGHAAAAYVKVKPAKPATNTPQATLTSAAVVARESIQIKLAPPQKNFYEMKAFVGAAMKGESQEVSITTVQDEGATVRFNAPKLAKTRSGDGLLVQLMIKAAPDNRPPQPFGGPMTGVYYESTNDAWAQIKPAGLKDSEIESKSFTITLPQAVEQAYPGSDVNALDVKLEGEEKAPKLEVSTCKRNSPKSKEGTCAFQVRRSDNTNFSGDTEYKVSILTKGQRLPVNPEKITIHADSSKTTVKPRAPR